MEQGADGTDRIEDGMQMRRTGSVSSSELFKAVLAHPSWRVCEEGSEKGYARPLRFVRVDDAGAIVFEHDLASTPMHPHATCTELIDRIGQLPSDIGSPVVMLPESSFGSDAGGYAYSRIIYDPDARWIILRR